MENNLNKQNVWYHLLNFSKDKFLNSKYFHDNLIAHIDFTTPQGKEALKDTQRKLAEIINQLISDLQTLKSEDRIISSDAGYKIAATPDECLDGANYLYSKVKDVLVRINWLKSGYNEKTHKNSDKSTEDMFAQSVGAHT